MPSQVFATCRATRNIKYFTTETGGAPVVRVFTVSQYACCCVVKSLIQYT